MKTLLFNFETMAATDKAVREAVKLFARAGAHVVGTDVAKTLTRRAGVTFRNISLTFADGQVVVLAVKSTGDVFEVRLNNRVLPLRNQDDHTKAIGEVADRMQANRGAFQRALARLRVPLPPSVRVSRQTMLAALIGRRDALVEAVAAARSELAQLTEVPAV